MAQVLTQTDITPQTVAAFRSENTTSIHNMDKPYVVNQLYQKYGMRWRTLVNLLRIMGGEKPFGRNSINAYAQGKIVRTITIEGTPSGGASGGATAQFYLHRDDINSDGDCFLRVGDSIYQQLSNGNIKDLRVKSISDASTSNSQSQYSSKLVTVEPKDSSHTIMASGDSLADGDELSVGGNSFAHGVGFPEGTTRGYYERQFKNTIQKEKKNMDTAELATDKWIKDQERVYPLAMLDLEWLLDWREEMNFMMSEENTNSITQTSPGDSKSRTVRSTKGLIPHLQDKAAKLDYGLNPSSFDVSYLDYVDDHIRTMHITSNVIDWFGGSGLGLNLEKGGINWVDSHSGGTDWTTAATRAFGNDDEAKKRALSIGFSTFFKNNVAFNWHVLDSWSAPDFLGNTKYNLKNSGFMVPHGENAKLVNSEGGTMRLNNLGIYYRQGNNVNRQRVINVLPGVGGTNLGQPVHENDYLSIVAMSEKLFSILEVEKMIYVRPL